MFALPGSTEVKKVIPKNAFDKYTNSRQKKSFSEKILRITWKNRIAEDTVNLTGKEIGEIQIFEVELKEKHFIKDILSIIEKAIPYHIIFIVRFGEEYYLSTSSKHIHPTQNDSAVVDYTFSTEWIPNSESRYSILLKNNLDEVYKTFCEQFTSINNTPKTLQGLVEHQKQTDSITREIVKLQSEISRCRQFNKKVEMNLRLQQLQDLLNSL